MLYFKASNQKPLKNLLSGNLVNGDNFQHSQRCLDFFVLLAGVEGTLFIEQDGQQETLKPGEFMLLFPGHFHRGYRQSEGMLSYFWAHFNVDGDYQLLDDLSASTYLQTLDMSGVQRDIYLLPQHGRFNNTNRIVLEFRQLIDISQQKPYSKAMENFALSLLAADLTQEFLTQNRQSPSASGILCNMIDIQEYIRLHFNSDLSIPKLAEMFGYNRNYLSTVYKKATGNSLIHYINCTRIAAAKTFLLDTTDSISDIAFRVGYNDSKYFIRVFRELEGMTPVMYRNVYFRKFINKE